jgi:tetratricopeptide (TPR) repeat protein
MKSQLGDELIHGCWRLLAQGRPYKALERAERALRVYRPPMDTVLAGRLYLIVGVCLSAVGRKQAARHYLRDASWALENAWDSVPAEPADTG